ncbi:MAG: hypothetical protein WBL81_12545, partial [Pseudolabrys sp.]
DARESGAVLQVIFSPPNSLRESADPADVTRLGTPICGWRDRDCGMKVGTDRHGSAPLNRTQRFDHSVSIHYHILAASTDVRTWHLGQPYSNKFY